MMRELCFFGKRFIVKRQARRADKIFSLTVTVNISKPRQKRSHLVDILLEGDRFIISVWVGIIVPAIHVLLDICQKLTSVNILGDIHSKS